MLNSRTEIIRNTIHQIGIILRNHGVRITSNQIVISAYMAYKLSDNRVSLFAKALECMDNNVIKMYLEENFNEEVFQDLLHLVEINEKVIFSEVAISADAFFFSEEKGDFSTPLSIVKLSQSILNVGSGDKVADICCGKGSFISSVCANNTDVVAHGYEINPSKAAIAMMKAEMVSSSAVITITDVLEYPYGEEKYNKIFANYPFGSRLKDISDSSVILNEFTGKINRKYNSMPSDWLYNYLITNLLTEDGKAIAITTNGCTWNRQDEDMRKYFVENGLIECVITLPERLFYSTSISTSMIIFSKGNTSVRLVDARKMCQKGRRYNRFSEDNIANIAEAAGKDGEHSKNVSIDELRKNEYNLSFSRYVSDRYEISDGVPFESIIKRVTRGAHISAKELDDLASDKDTDLKYLMLANIKDGIIDEKLPSLKSIDPKDEKYCLNNNSLVISKNGYPYKIAIAQIDDDQKVLANGNLYIIDLDEEKADPVYIKAFFESEIGIAALRSITAGASIPNIGVDNLKKLQIPLPSLEKQKRIASEYKAAFDEVQILRKRLAKAIDKMKHVYDNEVEE